MAAVAAPANTEPDSKKPRLDESSSYPSIATHNATFHADEALAVYLLRLLPDYTLSPLKRTRDPSKLAESHTVVDVGGVYDDKTKRYDHHQREFTTTFPGHATKLSSAGLVYMHFGRRIIAQQTGLDEHSAEVHTLYEKIYTDFIEAFDANDNGISAYDPVTLESHSIGKRFNDKGFTLASVVGRMNYAFDPAQEASLSPAEKQAKEDARFAEASRFTGGQFMAELTDLHRSWLPARAKVRAAFFGRQKWDDAGRIMVLEEGAPWQDHLFDAEAEGKVQGQVLYTLFPEKAGDKDSKWRIRAVSKSREGFELRKPLPEKWRGVRDEELSLVCGVGGCVFVHASGFIGGNTTFDGALAMVSKALTMD